MATLFIGGTSALASSYLVALAPAPDSIIVCGHEPPRPHSPAERYPFVSLDLTESESVRTLFQRAQAQQPRRITSVILAVRLSLLSTSHDQLARHLEELVKGAAAAGVEFILHISSVAVVDHLRPQHMMSEDDPPPPIAEYLGNYDVFKRRSEEVLTEACDANGLLCTHL